MLLKEVLPKSQCSKNEISSFKFSKNAQILALKANGYFPKLHFFSSSDFCLPWTWTFTIAMVFLLASRLGCCSCCCALSKKKWNSQHFHRRRACNVPSENLWNGIKAMTIYVTITAAAAGPKNVKSIFFFTRKGHKSRTFMVVERPKLINGMYLVF